MGNTTARLDRYRVLPIYQAQLHDRVTVQACAEACDSLQHTAADADADTTTPAVHGEAVRLAGIDAGNHCFCGDLLPGAGDLLRPAGECETTPCHANATETGCGGVGRMAVYSFACTETALAGEQPPRAVR